MSFSDFQVTNKPNRLDGTYARKTGHCVPFPQYLREAPQPHLPLDSRSFKPAPAQPQGTPLPNPRRAEKHATLSGRAGWFLGLAALCTCARAHLGEAGASRNVPADPGRSVAVPASR